MRIISPCSSALSAPSNDCVHKHIERVISRKREHPSGAAVRTEGGVAGEGSLVVYPSFIPWVCAPCH